MTDETYERWGAARAALSRAAERFAALVRSCPAPDRTLVTKDWTAADTAAHVLSIASLCVSYVDDDVDPPPVPGLRKLLDGTNVDTVAATNAYVMRHLTDRDAGAVCRRLLDAVDRFLRASEHTDPGLVVRWLGAASVTIAGLAAHLTNELLVHGWDIARTLRRPWPMPEADAALFFQVFFIGMLRHDHGALIETGARQPRGRVAVTFRSAYTPATTIALENRRVTIAPPGDRADATVTYRPARFNLMLFGRISTLSAVLHRDVVIGGPRPWLLPGFLRVVHMPNS